MQPFVVGSIVFLLVALGWTNRGFGGQTPAPRGELRIVDTDPINWAWITWNIFEHLVEIDKDGKLVPRLATTITPSQGCINSCENRGSLSLR